MKDNTQSNSIPKDNTQFDSMSAEVFVAFPVLLGEAGQALWDATVPYQNEWGHRIFFAVAFYLVHNLTYWPMCLLFEYMRSNNMFSRYLIQQKKPDPELTKQCKRELFVNHYIVHAFVTYYLLYPAFSGYTGNDKLFAAKLPGWTTMLWQILVSMIIEDAMFFWVHRTVHHPSLYKHIHKKHHKFKVSIGFAAEFSHPIEGLLANLIPHATGPILTQMHFSTVLLWLAMRLSETIDAHSGYAFPWSPWHLLSSIQGGSERHDFHHSVNTGSYGAFFTFWDWLFRSDLPFRAHQIYTMPQWKRDEMTQPFSQKFTLNLRDKTDANIFRKLADFHKTHPRDVINDPSVDGVPIDYLSQVKDHTKGWAKFEYVVMP